MRERPAATARPPAGWRPLLRFWLAVLFIAAAGGAVLEYLGPSSVHPPPGQSQPAPTHTAEPEAGPFAAGPASPSAPPADARPARDARSPDPASPSAPPADARPARDARSPDKAAQNRVQPRGRVLVVLHLPRSADGKAAAEQLASKVGLALDQVEAEAAADAPSRAIIRFYAAEDHALARRLGRELAQLGYRWQIENLSDRSPPPERQAVEVWLPER